MEKQVRQSNFELLRIVAMLLVLVTHVNFYSVGWPSLEDLQNSPLSVAGRILMESISIVSVNVFVLISGWFGIYPTRRKFTKFIFQCLFFAIGIWLVATIIGYRDLNLSTAGMTLFKSLFCADYWFVYAYIGLFIMAPILNRFIDNEPPSALKFFLLAFFLFEFIYGWVFDGNGFDAGYSAFSFIGMYCLGRYVRLYPSKMTTRKAGWDISAFLLCSLITAVLYIVALKVHFDDIQKPFSYTSPFVILSSLSLLLCFSKFKIQSRAINYVAASSFSAYLLHTHPCSAPLFVRCSKSIFNNNPFGSYLWKIGLFVLVVYLMATLIDQVRILVWKAVQNRKEIC